MPRVSSATLEKVTFGVFRAVGAPEEDARITARIIVESNLAGHDSHGVVSVPGYVAAIRNGWIVPGAPVEVVGDQPAYASGRQAPAPAHHTTAPAARPEALSGQRGREGRVAGREAKRGGASGVARAGGRTAVWRRRWRESLGLLLPAAPTAKWTPFLGLPNRRPIVRY